MRPNLEKAAENVKSIVAKLTEEKAAADEAKKLILADEIVAAQE